MPVTDQQARALTFLAVAARPQGAPRWDEAGVFANVMKVADRSLASVVIAVMQAAEDRKAVSPGVIPSNGPHWRDPVSAPEIYRPTNKRDDQHRCSVCTLLEADCKTRPRVADDDHEFLSVAANRAVTGRPAEAVVRIVDDLRDALHPTTAEEATNA